MVHRRGYDAFEGDAPHVLGLSVEDIEWHIPRPKPISGLGDPDRKG